jgi:signal transduction histidine kinase
MQLDAESHELAQFVVDGAARMSMLIEDLLTFARSGVREPLQWVNLQDAVAKAIHNLTPEIEASNAILNVDPLPVVRSNPTQLVRLFQNLISNALKYRSERPVEIYVTAQRRGPDWVIEVVDNGLGIAAEDHSRIFMPFIRLANHDVPGTGLGLAVCKKIVKGLGGEIRVESELGFGSTFIFTISAGEDAQFPLAERSLRPYSVK